MLDTSTTSIRPCLSPQDLLRNWGEKGGLFILKQINKQNTNPTPPPQKNQPLWSHSGKKEDYAKPYLQPDLQMPKNTSNKSRWKMQVLA